MVIYLERYCNFLLYLNTHNKIIYQAPYFLQLLLKENRNSKNHSYQLTIEILKICTACYPRDSNQH